MDKATDNTNEKKEELSNIYKIFKEIFSKAPPVLKDLSDETIDIGYTECLDDRIDLKKINNKFKNEKYTSMTDVLKDIRQVFLNCYTFYGIKSDYTRKSLKLEKLLEDKISHLDENFKSLADVQLTLNLLNIERNHNLKFRYPKDCYDSVLLRCVAHCRPERLKEYHKILSTTLTTDEDNAHILEELISWEKEIYFNDHYQFISSMWELPEIGNFVAIIFKELNFEIVNQGEIERMFLMPKESTTMSKIMTTLLMPVKKTKFIDRIMPYKVWSEKLSKKVSEWYKVYHTKKQNKVSVMKSLGVHPDFWGIVGDKNPLIECDYCELSYIMKVWLVKGLCDYVINKYKTINDVITNCNERQCTIWKSNMETEEYFFFNSMPDFRIYYYSIPFDEPSLEFLESEEIFSGTSSVHNKSRVEPNKKHFKLIADSVQGLRSFLYELDTEDTSVPENLISTLGDFIAKVESDECNLIVLNNNSKIKLFKDWKSYPERFKNEKDETLFWEEKESKSTSLVASEEVILEKRKRNVVVKQEFEFNFKCDSDEYYSESDEPDSNYTDSEDEWGAMNQSKNKAKLPVQTSSKLIELENRLREEGKLLNPHITNALNSNMKNKSQEIVKESESIENKQKENTEKNICRTNLVANGCDKKYVSSKNMSFIKIDMEISSDEKIMSVYSEKEENKKQLAHKKQKYTIENDKCINMPYNATKSKLDVSNDTEEEEIISVYSEKKESRKQLAHKKQKYTIENDKCINMPHNATKRKLDVSNDTEEVEIISVYSEKKESRKQLAHKKQKYTIENDKCINMPHNATKSKLDVSNDTEVVVLDDDDCEILKKDNSKSYSSTEGRKEKINQNGCIQIKPIDLNLNKNDIISIEDDNEEIVISDEDEDEDDIQFVSITPRTQELTPKMNRSYGLNNNLNTSYNSVSRNRQITPIKSPYTKREVASTSTPKLSPNITVMPANLHLPKGIEVTVVKKPQTTINSHFNATKRSNDRHLTNKPSVVNVKCRVISKPNSNGEVKFYVSLPNGKLHPVSDELMNNYLKEHNNRLPDYWLVPLPVEVAKQYGFSYNVK